MKREEGEASISENANSGARVSYMWWRRRMRNKQHRQSPVFVDDDVLIQDGKGGDKFDQIFVIFPGLKRRCCTGQQVAGGWWCSDENGGPFWFAVKKHLRRGILSLPETSVTSKATRIWWCFNFLNGREKERGWGDNTNRFFFFLLFLVIVIIKNRK